ncbi:MAG: ATP-binding cassette domain-containing protein [Acidobacteria bacterium]|nr:ATP-binding cassette domain-containing protein [Acidobacteriota bacterium]
MIVLRDVCKSYGDDRVLDHVSLRVGAGRSHVILGGSGSGKSTLLRVMAGLEPMDSGEMFIRTKNVSQVTAKAWKKLRRQVGIVFQEGALFDSLSVRDNVGYSLIDEGGWPREEIDQAARRVLGFVGLQHTLDQMPSELSGGMRRRVAIARAIVAEPRIMLYDEPTAGLDPVTSRTICDLIVKLRDVSGVTSVIVTHDLSAAFFFAGYGMDVAEDGNTTLIPEGDTFRYVHTEFSVLNEGRIIFTGTRDALLETPIPYIRSFLA